MATTYWEIGRRIVELEPAGQKRTATVRKLLEKMSEDLSRRFGRGFGPARVAALRQIYLPAI